MATIYGNAGNNRLNGTASDDRIVARAGNDKIYGNGGRDVLFGDDGNDTIYLGKFGVYPTVFGSHVDGGAGTDLAILYLQNFTQNLTLAASASAYARVAADMGDGSVQTVTALRSIEEVIVYFGSGDDYFRSNGGKATILAGAGEDRLFGGNVVDYLSGQDGDDVLFGYGGNDLLAGGNGADRIYGGDGKDNLSGDAGDDRMLGEAGDDFAYGGYGADVMFGGDGGDTLYGDDDDDRIYGETGDDWLYAEQGDDLIEGGDGRDLLSGGDGVDRLYGGLGPDTLHGGSGHDRFGWINPSEGGDRVLDFRQGQDILLFDGAGFGGVTSVDASNFVSNSVGAAKDAADRFLFSQNTGALFFDPDGNGAAAKTLIAHIEFIFGTELAASDIRIG